MPTIKVEDEPNVEVQPGEAITLEVPGAGTTGHLWRLQANPEVVEVVEHQVSPDEESFGGAGVERFVVKPLREGDATLRFELKAPWEAEPVETHDVHVHAVPKR